MKESRLFKLVYYLLSNGRTSASQLSIEFEVSTRTIYRDIDALSSAGIPIYAETGRNGGIALLDNFVVDKVLLSDSEKQNILSSLQSLSVLDNIYEKEILTKLSALFDIHLENWFEVDFSRWGYDNIDNNKFTLLKEAIVNHKKITIIYVSSYGVKSERSIHPLKFLYKSKAWYIKAYCPNKEDFRIFKFNRIVQVKMTNEVFIPTTFPEQKKPPVYTYNDIILHFPKEVAYRVYDEFDICEIEEDESGMLIVTSAMPKDSWLIGYLLSFGAQVEIIEPRYLRDVLAKEAKKIYEMNKL